jgi:hypothetical protein
MEAAGMKSTFIFVTLSALLIAGASGAGEVYRTQDNTGHPVYTDKPDKLPAEKLDIKTSDTDVVGAQERYDAMMEGAAESDAARTEAAAEKAATRKAEKAEAADLVKRCNEARDNYQSLMRARRIYEPGAVEGERRYLDDNEISAARDDAKQLMDEYCNDR